MVQKNDWGDKCDIRFFLSNIINQYQPSSLADIACGMGYVTQSVHPRTKIVYMDYDLQKLKNIKHRKNSEIIQGDLFSVPFSDETFPFVLASHCVPEWDFDIPFTKQNPKSARIKFLRELFRITKLGGTIMITTPNGEHPIYWGKNKGTLKEIIELLKSVKCQGLIYGWNQYYTSGDNLLKRVFNKTLGFFLFLFSFYGPYPLSLLNKQIKKSVSIYVLLRKRSNKDFNDS